MKLPVPVLADGKVFTDVKIGEASAGTLASARREADAGAEYSALLEWCVGVAREISGDGDTVTDPQEIKRLIKFMPFESVYAVACYGMAETKGDDSIPGEYQCPKCGRIVRLEKSNVDGEEIDDTDHLRTLKYGICSNPESGISLSLSRPIEIPRKDTGEIIETIESIVMDWPTLGQCIRAHQKNPDNESAMMFAVYADAIRLVNGKKIDSSWRASFGDLAFSRMMVRDQAALVASMKKYSIQSKVSRACMKCKTRWDAEVDLRGFFSSGLTGD